MENHVKLTKNQFFVTCVKSGFILNVAFLPVSSLTHYEILIYIPYFCAKCNCHTTIVPFQNVTDEEFSNNLTATEFAMSKMDIISKILQVTSNNIACNN